MSTEFSVSKRILTPVLKQVARACGTGKGSEPIHGCILIQACKGKPGPDGSPPAEDYLNLAASNTVMSIRTRVVAKVTATGTIAIPGGRLVEILGALRGEDTIGFDANPDHNGGKSVVALIAGKNGRIEFPLEDPAKFPAINSAKTDKVTLYPIKSDLLSTAFKLVKHASKAETTSNFHGVHCGSNPSYATTFSDGAAALVPISWPTGLLPSVGVLLPSAVVDMCLSLIDAGTAIVDFGIFSQTDGVPSRIYLRDKGTEIAVQLPGNVFPAQLPDQIIARAKGIFIDGEVITYRPWLWIRMSRDHLVDSVRVLQAMLAGLKTSTATCKVSHDTAIGSTTLDMEVSGTNGGASQQIQAKGFLATPVLIESVTLDPAEGDLDPVPVNAGTSKMTDWAGNWIFDPDLDPETGLVKGDTTGRRTFLLTLATLAQHLAALAPYCAEVEIGISTLVGQMQFIRPVIPAGNPFPGYTGMIAPIDLTQTS